MSTPFYDKKIKINVFSLFYRELA